jgi:hypothetical protein
MPRAAHEGKLWLRTLLAAAVAATLLQGGVLHVGDAGDTSTLRAFQGLTLRIVLIHGVIALCYLVFPKRPPEDGPEDGGERPAERPAKGSALSAGHPQDVAGGQVGHPRQDEQQVR